MHDYHENNDLRIEREKEENVVKGIRGTVFEEYICLSCTFYILLCLALVGLNELNGVNVMLEQ